MTIKTGSNDIVALYIGLSEIQKAYLGSSEVYASMVVDWDTYANGVWYQPYFVDRDDSSSLPLRNKIENYTRSKPLGTAVSSYSQYDMSLLSYPILENKTGDTTGTIQEWGDDDGRIVCYVRDAGTTAYTQGVEVPWGWALYSITDQEWKGYAPYTSTGSDRHFTSPAFITGNEHTGDRVILVSLSDDPGNAVTEWRDYDGPDDWDTWENGLFVVRNWASVDTSLADMTVVKPSSSYSTPTDNFYNSPVRGRYYAANQYPGWIAIWSITSNSWVAAATVSSTFGTTDPNIVVRWGDVGEYTMTEGDDYIVVYLTREPQNFANWRNYDGPIYSGWDDPNWSYVGLAAGPGNDSSIGVMAIPTPYSEGSLIGMEYGSRSNAYQWRGMNLDYGVTDRYTTFGVRYQVYYTQHTGWLRRGPVASQWGLGDAPTYPLPMNYSLFYTYGPLATFDSAEDPGDVNSWPDYNGPFANWDTYANGVYSTQRVGTTSSYTLYQVPSYNTTTYTSAPTVSLWTSVNPDSITGGNIMEHNVYDPSQTQSDSDKPPYIAVYLHEYQANGTFGSMPPGWYVYKNEDQTYRPRGRTCWETPIAWPTASGSYNWYQAAIDAGYMGAPSGNSGYILVYLDDYQDPVGEGGTDHWTKPPWINSADISSINLSTQRIVLDYGGSSQYYAATYNGITDFGSYHFEPLRGLSWLVRDMSGYGSVSIEVYHNSVLVGTGTWNATVGDTNVDFVSFNNLVGYASQADFYNAAQVGDRMTFIAYYND